MAKHNHLISTELRRSHLPNYNVVDTELRRSHLPNYSVVDTELQRSHLPNYDVVDTELRRSHKGSPIKVSNEGIQLRSTPLTPQPGNECVGKENLTPQPEEPGTRIQPPSLANLSNQPDSQLQPLNPHEEHCSAASLIGDKTIELNKVGENQLESLIGNKTMELETVEKNQLELAGLLEGRQNFDPARSQNDKAIARLAIRESRAGDEYSAAAAIEPKIAAPQTNPPVVSPHQPEPALSQLPSMGSNQPALTLDHCQIPDPAKSVRAQSNTSGDLAIAAIASTPTLLRQPKPIRSPLSGEIGQIIRSKRPKTASVTKERFLPGDELNAPMTTTRNLWNICKPSICRR